MTETIQPETPSRHPVSAYHILPLLDRTGVAATLATPLLLLHAPSAAEGTIALTGLCFLVHAALLRDWRWLRAAWVPIALVWWAWVMVCSLPVPALGLGPGGVHSFVESVATIRFLLFAAALEHWTLRPARIRRWLFWIVAAAAAWIALESLQQLLTGRNLLGYPRGRDGELTGPFRKPRAGPPLSRILFPAILPLAARLLERRRWPAGVGAYALLLGAVLIMVLIGQRMPLMLTGLGLVVAAVLLPRLRPAVIAAGLAGLVLVGMSAIVSPPTYHRLVLKFSQQMESFPTSQYGQLYARAWHIGQARPLVGRGFDGFRTGCTMPRYFGPTFDDRQPHGGGADICAAHPHNFYAQALDDGGFPGLLLFCATVLAWLAPLARGLWRHPAPLRVALFASVLVQLWPLASTSDFVNMPMGGWLFLLLGWGLAEARWPVPSAPATLAGRAEHRIPEPVAERP
ncbi:MAG TPA: O-antigen ligase family protein [Acetobacteraceae bacterium]